MGYGKDMNVLRMLYKCEAGLPGLVNELCWELRGRDGE